MSPTSPTSPTSPWPLARATGAVALTVAALMGAASAGFSLLALRVHNPGWTATVPGFSPGPLPAAVAMDAHGHPVLDLGPQQPTVALYPGTDHTLVARLGGSTIPPTVLETGRGVYVQHCSPCHGDRGDGHGPSADGLTPPPRDFTTGRFKFAAVPTGALPHDSDLARTIRRGLRGTAMRGWDLPPDDITAVVQYLKTLSPRWRRDAPGVAVTPEPTFRHDPWTPARRADAEARGEAVYHGQALCSTCHPAYATRARVSQAALTLTHASAVFRDNPHVSVPSVEDGYGTPVLPPDFTRYPLRAGDTVEDLYRTLSSGVGGTPMPGWRDGLPEADIWALAYYVHGLTMLRDTPAAVTLADTLAADEALSQPPALRPAPGR